MLVLRFGQATSRRGGVERSRSSGRTAESEVVEGGSNCSKRAAAGAVGRRSEGERGGGGGRRRRWFYTLAIVWVAGWNVLGGGIEWNVRGAFPVSFESRSSAH